MDLNKWLKIRTDYLKRANLREQERANLDLSSKDEDIPYYAKVQDEMLMDIFDELAKIKALYEPAPENVDPKVDTGERTFKQRLRLG